MRHMKKACAAWLAVCLICCAVSGCFAEATDKTCTFDGYTLSYPEGWEYLEDEQGIFLCLGEGFFQISTAIFPEGKTGSAQDLLSSGAIASVVGEMNEIGLQYTSGGEIVSCGAYEYVFLTSEREGTLFDQYVGFADHTLMIFTVKGEECRAAARDIIATLRPAGEGEVSSDAASREYNPEKQLTRKDSAGKDRLVGFVGDPVPCAYSRFAEIFTGSLEALGRSSVPHSFSRCYYSDGRYVHTLTYYYAGVRVYVSSDAPDAQIEQVMISVDKSQCSEKSVRYQIYDLLLSAYGSLSPISEITYDALFTLAQNDALTYDGPDLPFWTENGWTVVFDQDENYAWCDISYLGETEPAAAPMTPCEYGKYKAFSRPGLTVESFRERFDRICEAMQMAPLDSGEYEPFGDGRSWNAVYGENCRLTLLCLNETETEEVSLVMIQPMAPETDAVMAGALAALYAVTDMEMEEIPAVNVLGGNTWSWEQLSAMKPYVYFDGVALQVYATEDTLLCAIYGAGEGGQ